MVAVEVFVNLMPNEFKRDVNKKCPIEAANLGSSFSPLNPGWRWRGGGGGILQKSGVWLLISADSVRDFFITRALEEDFRRAASRPSAKEVQKAEQLIAPSLSSVRLEFFRAGLGSQAFQARPELETRAFQFRAFWAFQDFGLFKPTV